MLRFETRAPHSHVRKVLNLQLADYRVYAVGYANNENPDGIAIAVTISWRENQVRGIFVPSVVTETGYQVADRINGLIWVEFRKI